MPVTANLGDVPSGVASISFLLSNIEKQTPIFMCVFARIFGITMQAPIFSNKSLPPQVRATIVFTLTLMYMLTIQPKMAQMPTNMIMFAIILMKELLVGVIFGFCASIIVSAIQAAGEIIDVQMGLSMVTLFNPATKSQSSAMGRIFYQIQGMVFIMAHGHLFLLAVFFSTFDTLPIGSFNFTHPLVLAEFIKIVGKLFYISAKLALPLLIVLFIIDFSLGITNKVSPQINVLELMTAMKPTAGMLIILILCTSLVSVVSEYTTDIVKDAGTIIKAMAKANSIQGH